MTQTNEPPAKPVDRTPSAEDQSLLGAKGDPVEGQRDIPEDDAGNASEADRQAEHRAP